MQHLVKNYEGQINALKADFELLPASILENINSNLSSKHLSTIINGKLPQEKD